MHESNGHAAFSYAAGNALDRVVANVTYTEEARKICFQQKWSTICHPTWLVAHLAPRADIAVFALELRWQPMGYCIGADHDKQCICSPPDDRLPRFPGFYCFQVIRAVCRDHLSFRLHPNARRESSLIDQVLRHAALQIFAATQHGHRTRVICEEQGSLAGRVAAADDKDALSSHRGGLRTCGSIQDSTPDEAIDAVRLKSAPSNSGRQDHRLCGNPIAAIESNRVCAIGMRNDLLDFSGENHFGSELNCLAERALTEFIA